MGKENQNITEVAPVQQQEKTFTQDQLNAIVGKRLAEQKQQQEADLLKREQELNRREMNIRAQELLAEKGLPKNLAEVLRYDNEEELVKAIGIMETTRGFREQAEEGKKKRIVIPNPLNKGTGDYDETNTQIAEAFKRKDE